GAARHPGGDADPSVEAAARDRSERRARRQDAGAAVDGDLLPAATAAARYQRHVGAHPPAAVDGAAIAADHPLLAFLDVFVLHVRAGRVVGKTLAGGAVDLDEAPARRHRELDRALALERPGYELLEDRAAERAAVGARAEAARGVVADETACGDAGAVADEPDVLRLVAGAGLAGEVEAEPVDGGCAGAAADRALKHGGDLVGGDRVHDPFGGGADHR